MGPATSSAPATPASPPEMRKVIHSAPRDENPA